MILGSDLYALSQGCKNEGIHMCHWCGGRCKSTWIHDDPPLVPFTRTKSSAKVPSSLYVCIGCWLFRRKLTTVTFLNGTIKDRQTASAHSLYITETECCAIGKPEPPSVLSPRPGSFPASKASDYQLLYERLLNPPLRFALAFTDPMPNQLQLIAANDCSTVDKNTPLTFTLNNQPQTYTVYELEEGIKKGPEGKMPGVQTLLRILGAYDPVFPLSGVLIKKDVGRPSTAKDPQDGRQVKKMVTPLSGSLAKV